MWNLADGRQATWTFWLFMAAAVVPAGTTFSCTPQAVWDGDGPIWCAEGSRIRLAGIAAREADETCNANQPCPDATALDAKAALVQTRRPPRRNEPERPHNSRGPYHAMSVRW